jgi:DNA-binding GntR family transcriptional regulator
MQLSPPDASEAQTVLQRRLAGQIAEWIRRDGLTAGQRINQLKLAERFGVSRTPVKAALLRLSESGAVRFVARGVVVADPDARHDDSAAPDTANELIRILAADRHRGQLPQDISEADLMRRYGEPRAAIVAALGRLRELGVVLRKPGFGWRFKAAETPEEKRAAYRFRIAIEPAALVEPGYAPDRPWLAEMRTQHERFLDNQWRDSDAVAFFEMNAQFHLGLVSFSRNRFFIQATEQQNSLRRLRNYSWRLGPDRVRVSCEDHLRILDEVERGRMTAAADLMRRHLATTAELVVPSAETDDA